MKVAVLGASGGIGQPLSLLLKTCHLVTELALYDIKGTVGVSADLSHIPTDTHVSGYLPTADGLRKALTGAGMVVIPAGVPRQPGMTCRADLFNLNAGIVESLAEGVAQYCPNAFVLLITNPVNSTLPILAEVLKKAGVFNPARVLGVTTLDVVRAQTFASGFTNAPTKDITIPVVGGHSNETIIPLFSQAQPSLSIPTDDLHKITARVQRGGEEVVQAKGGFSSATLSMAFAGFRLAQTIMRAVSGEIGLIEPTFLSVIDIPGGADIAVETGSSYFAVPVLFGPQGAVYAHNPLPNVSEYEAGLLREGVPELKRQIQQGVDFVRRNEMVNGPWDKRSNTKEIVYSTTTEMVCSSL